MIFWNRNSGLDDFRNAMEARREGQMTEEEFRRVRLVHGVHRQRGGTAYMIRSRSQAGRLDWHQFKAIAELAMHSPSGRLHLTSRQDFQIYGFHLEELPTRLEFLEHRGIETRDSGGATIRNITCPPESGLLQGQESDPWPWAAALYERLQSRPEFETLPRKVKIAFVADRSSREARAAALTSDLAFWLEGEWPDASWNVYVGGGMAEDPMPGLLAWKGVESAELGPLAEAILRHYDRHAERQPRHLARVKHFVRLQGLPEFRAAVAKERAALDPSSATPLDAFIIRGTPSLRHDPERAVRLEVPQDWLENNCLAQNQAPYLAVRIDLPLGDLDAGQALGLSRLGESLDLPELRLGMSGYLVLPFVRPESLRKLYDSLESLGLVGRESQSQVHSCPGPLVCDLALLDPRSLSEELGHRLKAYEADSRLTPPLDIRVSGCPNSCSHHGLADLCLQGLVRREKGAALPCFQLLIPGSGAVGRPVGLFSARRVPEALDLLLARWTEEDSGECFREWLAAKERLAVVGWLEPLAQRPLGEQDRLEWGAKAEFFPPGEARAGQKREDQNG